MELADGGFELTYTKPLSDATLADLAEQVQGARSGRYAPTSSYGGPKIDEEALTVTDATVSADRKVVTLKIDGLKPNRVVYLRSPRPFAAQDGTELLSTEAWYTLNKLPGYVAPVSDGLYELEDGVLDRRREVRHRARRLHRHRLRVRHPDRRRVVGEGRRQRGQGRRLPDGAALRQRPEPVPGPEEDHA